MIQPIADRHLPSLVKFRAGVPVSLFQFWLPRCGRLWLFLAQNEDFDFLVGGNVGKPTKRPSRSVRNTNLSASMGILRWQTYILNHPSRNKLGETENSPFCRTRPIAQRFRRCRGEINNVACMKRSGMRGSRRDDQLKS
jgi:hypothetical protein